MVLISLRTNYLKALLFIFILVLLSCDKEGWFINCQECVPEEPVVATLLINFESYRRMKTTPQIEIFLGNIEDGRSIATFSQWIGTSSYTVSINKKYTVTATYIDESGNKYVAVDSATPRVIWVPDKCEQSCYYVYDRTVNLKLKYSK